MLAKNTNPLLPVLQAVSRIDADRFWRSLLGATAVRRSGVRMHNWQYTVGVGEVPERFYEEGEE